MTWTLNQIPVWAQPVVWTALTLLGGYLLGHVINAIVLHRLAALASRTDNDWDDIVIAQLKRRIPFWSFLIAVWLALGHWPLRPDVRGLAEQILTALADISITLAISSTVSRLVVSYQTQSAPDVPVTKLTQNLVRIVVLMVGILMIANALGLDITAALTALGVGGLAVALAPRAGSRSSSSITASEFLTEI
jgi:small-conductance mechanosensitive channel